MDTALDKLPAIAGTIPQWGMFILLAIAVVRTSPQWLQTMVTAARERRDRLGNRIKELEAKVEDCEKKCDEREVHYKEEIDELKTKINNEAWQRVQSEISLVNTLVQILPNPMLKQVLEALQRRSRSLPIDAEALGGIVADAKGNGK